MAKDFTVVWSQDRGLRYTWIHNARMGFDSSDVLGKTDRDLLDEASAAKLERIKRQVIQTGDAAYEVVVTERGQDSEAYDLYVRPLRDAVGDIAGVVCLAVYVISDALGSPSRF